MVKRKTFTKIRGFFTKEMKLLVNVRFYDVMYILVISLGKY